MKPLLLLVLVVISLQGRTTCEAYYWVFYCNMADGHTVICVLSQGVAPIPFEEEEKLYYPCHGHILKIINVKLSPARFTELLADFSTFQDAKTKSNGGKGPCQ